MLLLLMQFMSSNHIHQYQVPWDGCVLWLWSFLGIPIFLLLFARIWFGIESIYSSNIDVSEKATWRQLHAYVLFIFWIIFLLDLELNFIGKLLVFRWELIVLLLLQICFFFVMREISWSLSHVKIRLTLLRLSIQLKIPWRFIKYWQYLLWPNGGPDIPYRTPIK